MKMANLNIKLGKDSEGNYFSYDIQRMGHLLIGGAFGTGKSGFLHNTIKQLTQNNTPEEIKFIFSDCQKLDLINYSSITYMHAPVITEHQGVIGMFRWLDAEQDRRFELLIKERVKTTDDYNEKYQSSVLPRIVIVINELADVSHEYSKVEKIIVKILQYSKYSGIHLILATHVSSSEVLTDMIKANTYSRIAFKTEDAISSFLFLNQKGAEELNGKGEFLFLSPESTRPIKLQSDFISASDLAEFIKTVSLDAQKYNEELVDAINNDYPDITESQINEAVKILNTAGSVSASKIMAGLDISHAKANKILDILEERGIVSKIDLVTKRRKLLF
jgi:S-DNA-T family DNA segregation ATPase FtsK/SpoIIIE